MPLWKRLSDAITGSAYVAVATSAWTLIRFYSIPTESRSEVMFVNVPPFTSKYGGHPLGISGPFQRGSIVYESWEKCQGDSVVVAFNVAGCAVASEFIHSLDFTWYVPRIDAILVKGVAFQASKYHSWREVVLSFAIQESMNMFRSNLLPNLPPSL